MATNDDIVKALKDNLADGIAESQLADRRERKFSPKEIADGLKAIQAVESSQSSPILRVSFTGRHI
jgi:hypothetical protein